MERRKMITVLFRGQFHEIELEPGISVLDVKMALHRKVGLLPQYQFLSMESRKLEEHEKLSEIGVQENDTLNLEEAYNPAENTLKVMVSDNGPLSRTLVFKQGSKIEEVIAKINSFYGARGNQVLLEYEGTFLSPDSFLSDYQVRDNGMLRVITQLQGGA